MLFNTMQSLCVAFAAVDVSTKQFSIVIINVVISVVIVVVVVDLCDLSVFTRGVDLSQS